MPRSKVLEGHSQTAACVTPIRKSHPRAAYDWVMARCSSSDSVNVERPPTIGLA
jgi:hypothetical protein